MTSADHNDWERAVQWLRAQPDMHEMVLDAYYDDPLEEAAARYWHSLEWQAIRNWLPPPGRALDVGAGRGIASFALAREGFSVVALEPDPSSLVGAGAITALAHTSALPIEVCQQYGEKLPFADCQFDLVFARAALHHIADLNGAAREFCRVLKPGGRLIAIREHVISKRGDLQSFLDRHPLHRLYGGENALLLHEYVGALRQGGLTVAKVIAPLASVINTAPHTDETLQRELAGRVGRLVPGLPKILRGLWRVPGSWSLALKLMSVADDRPGRLYSFIADRP